MWKYGENSLRELSTCHEDLQEILHEAIKLMDLAVIQGHRTKVEQDEYFAIGTSEVQWPHSKHNTQPSRAVDVAPYPIEWADRERMHYMAGMIKGIALDKGIALRWGGDWDMDGEVKDNTFDDLVHFELKG